MLKVHNFSVQHGGLRRTFQTSRKRQVTRSNLTCKSRKKVETSSHLVPRVSRLMLLPQSPAWQQKNMINELSPLAVEKKIRIVACGGRRSWKTEQIYKKKETFLNCGCHREVQVAKQGHTAKLTHVYNTATIQRSFETFCKLGSKITCKKQPFTPHIK